MGDFFVCRPIVAMVMSIIMVLLGLVAMASLPIAQYPEIVPPMVLVKPHRGARAIKTYMDLAKSKNLARL